ncbi:hypothetical protein D3C81_1867610 [compost metagenome]
MGKQVRAGDQVADTQTRQQGFRHGPGIDPAGRLQAADNRRGAATVEGQFAIRLVFNQRHAEFIEQRRHRVAFGFAVTHRRWILEGRDQVDESRAVLFQASA